MTPEARAERWSRESEYFDAWAERIPVEPVPAATLRRYGARPPRPFWQKEFRFRLLGDLHGKTVLDVGCGHGANASLLARLGARVTGLDVSPGAVRAARARARANGVEDRVELVCSPIETADLPAGAFDVIWGDAILHHLTSELDLVMANLARWARPGGLLVFAEPIRLCPALRRLRGALPFAPRGTPDERPLEPRDLAIVARHLDDLAMRPFALLTRFFHYYETLSAPRRLALDALARADWALLSVPALAPLAGVAVLWGRPRR
jgi:SAM-dependent methyltransferase